MAGPGPIAPTLPPPPPLAPPSSVHANTTTPRVPAVMEVEPTVSAHGDKRKRQEEPEGRGGQAANGAGAPITDGDGDGGVRKAAAIAAPNAAHPVRAPVAPPAAPTAEEADDDKEEGELEEGELEEGELEEGELEEGEVEEEAESAPVQAVASRPAAPPAPLATAHAPRPVAPRTLPTPPPPPSNGAHPQPTSQPPRGGNRPPPPPPAQSQSSAPAPAPAVDVSSGVLGGELLPPNVVARRPTGLGLDKWLNFSLHSKYIVESEIGSGTYGTVSRARVQGTENYVAIKRMPLALQTSRPFDGVSITTIREIKALKRLGCHENVVSLLELFSPPDAEDNGSRVQRVPREICLVMEYCEMDLCGIVRAMRLTPAHIRSFMFQILSGLSFIHAKKILHRDLKTSNILVTKDLKVKIADWGLCRTMPETVRHSRWQVPMSNPVVTLFYRAPELLMGARWYNEAVDMWSVGIIMAELLVGKPLFRGRDDIDQLFVTMQTCGSPQPGEMKGVDPSILQHFPPAPRRLDRCLQELGVKHRQTIKVMDMLLQLDPSKRPSADQICDDDYFWLDFEEGPDGTPGNAKPDTLPRLTFKDPSRRLNMNQLHEFSVNGGAERLAIQQQQQQQQQQAMPQPPRNVPRPPPPPPPPR